MDHQSGSVRLVIRAPAWRSSGAMRSRAHRRVGHQPIARGTIPTLDSQQADPKERGALIEDMAESIVHDGSTALSCMDLIP